MATREPMHTGWIVTNDLRPLDPEASYLGAVPRSMTPEALLRLADTAHDNRIEPLLHRVTPKAPGDASAFLIAPRIRSGRGYAIVRPMLTGAQRTLSALWFMAQLSAKIVSNTFERATTQRAAQRRPAPIRLKSPRRANPSPSSPRTAVDSGATRGAREQSAPTPAPAPASKPNANPIEPGQWQRAHEWTIVDASGTPLLRGSSIGVEGDTAMAARARRAPLNEIPGLPRDAAIQWQGQPSWDAAGVSRTAAARNVAFVTRRAINEDGLNWPTIRRAAAQSTVMLGGEVTQPRQPRAYDAALDRLAARFADTRAEDAIAEVLQRVREGSAAEAAARSAPVERVAPDEPVAAAAAPETAEPAVRGAGPGYADEPVIEQAPPEYDDIPIDEDAPEYDDIPIEEPPTDRYGVAV